MNIAKYPIDKLGNSLEKTADLLYTHPEGWYLRYGFDTETLFKLSYLLRKNINHVQKTVQYAHKYGLSGTVSHYIPLYTSSIHSLEILVDYNSINPKICLLLCQKNPTSISKTSSYPASWLFQYSSSNSPLVICPVLPAAFLSHLKTADHLENTLPDFLSYHRLSNSYGILKDDQRSLFTLELPPGYRLSSTLFSQHQKLISLEVENILHCMIQVGSQLDTFHKQGGTHLDVKTDNICVTKPSDQPSKATQYELIGYPDTCTQPLHKPQLLYEQGYLLETTSLTAGISAPILPNTIHPNSTAESSFKNLLCYIGLHQCDQALYLAKAKQSDHKIYAHALDSYGYLYVLYDHILHNPRLEKMFRSFLCHNMALVLEKIQNPDDDWPESLTVAGIQSRLHTHCRTQGVRLMFKKIKTNKKAKLQGKPGKRNNLDQIKKTATLRSRVQQEKLRQHHYDVIACFLDFFDCLFHKPRTSYTIQKAFTVAMQSLKQKGYSKVIPSIDFILSKNTLPLKLQRDLQIAKQQIILLKSGISYDKTAQQPPPLTRSHLSKKQLKDIAVSCRKNNTPLSFKIPPSSLLQRSGLFHALNRVAQVTQKKQNQKK